jgi:hypothetical protein
MLAALCEKVRTGSCGVGAVLLQLSKDVYTHTGVHRVGLLLTRTGDGAVDILVHTGGSDWGLDVDRIVGTLARHSGGVRNVVVSKTHLLQRQLRRVDTGMCRWYVLLFLVVAIKLRKKGVTGEAFDRIIARSEEVLVDKWCKGDHHQAFAYVTRFAHSAWNDWKKHYESKKRKR